MKTLLSIALLLFFQGAGGSGNFGGSGGMGGGVSAPPSTVNYGVTTFSGGGTAVGGGANLCNPITVGSDPLGYTVNSIRLYGNNASTANMTAAIYTTGTIGVTLISSAPTPVVLSTSPTWNVIAIGGTLAASTSYNICINTDIGFNYFTAGSGTVHLLSGTLAYPTWTTPTNVTDDGVFNLSLYVTVTPN